MLLPKQNGRCRFWELKFISNKMYTYIYIIIAQHHCQIVQLFIYYYNFGSDLKGLAQAKIIKKSVILFRVLNMTIWCKHVHRLELQIFIMFVLRIHQLG